MGIQPNMARTYFFSNQLDDPHAISLGWKSGNAGALQRGSTGKRSKRAPRLFLVLFTIVILVRDIFESNRVAETRSGRGRRVWGVGEGRRLLPNWSGGTKRYNKHIATHCACRLNPGDFNTTYFNFADLLEAGLEEDRLAQEMDFLLSDVESLFHSFVGLCNVVHSGPADVEKAGQGHKDAVWQHQLCRG